MSLSLAFAVCLLIADGVGGQGGGGLTAHRTKEPFANDGTPADADLPAGLHMRNTGGIGKKGPGTGAGLCVFTSCEMVCRTLNVPTLYGLQKWMTNYQGGANASRLDQMIAQFCKAKGTEKPTYFHVRSNDLSILRRALKSGRPVGITYNFSPTGNYGGDEISHMVTLVAAGAGKGPDGKGWYCVVDNNYPGQWEWMSESQFLRVAGGGGTLWAVIFTAPSSPPSPRN